MTAAQTEHPGARLCPNCGQRPGDTNTAYDEVVTRAASEVRSARGREVQVRMLTKYGRVWLCTPCAVRYGRLVALRARSQPLQRLGGIVLVVGILLFALLYAAVQGDEVMVALLSLPMLAGAVLLLVGLGMVVAVRVRKVGATRFLTSPKLAHMAAPEERRTAASTPLVAARPPEEMLTREERRALRARRRRQARMKGAALAAGGIAGLAVVITLASLLLAHLSIISTSGTAYSADLTGTAAGWPNDTSCGEHDGAYHIAPPGVKYGVTCLAPAGSFSNFDVQVTAQLASGPAQSEFGVVFRAGDALTVGNGYIFEVAANGAARLDIEQNGTVKALSPEWQFPAGVSRVPGASHVLEVQASGGTLTCLVDGSQVGSFSDSRFSSGRVGLYVAQPGTDVAFTQFSVTPA